VEVFGVKESIVQHLRTQIITGELAPGQKLNEVELSSALGISRPPLREAFRVLENEHLIISVPRKGTYVSDLSVKNLREVFQVRVMIECFAIDLLKAKNIRSLPDVESALALSSGLCIPTNDNKQEMLKYLESRIACHRKLITSADNDCLVHFYDSIHSSLARYQFIYTHVPGQASRFKKEHKEILGSIEKGDYERAKQRLTSHINSVVDILERKIGRETPSRP
jgi:DNA-binding GntR family transcriptional regulator